MTNLSSKLGYGRPIQEISIHSRGDVTAVGAVLPCFIQSAAAGFWNTFQTLLPKKMAPQRPGGPWCILVLVMTVCSATSVSSTTLPTISWTRGRFLDGAEQLVYLQWSVQDDHITMEVTARTKGYVGIGLSHKGGMKGADIIVGWVYQDEPVIQDRFAPDYVEPVLDEHQDVELLGGYENNTHTVFRFRRKLNTCDQQDIEISADTVRVLYATNDHDPVDNILQFHGSNRGSGSVIFVNDGGFDASWKEKDVVTWDVLNSGTDVPTVTDTLYWATIHKVPDLPTKHHIIAWEPVVPKHTLPFVHHMLLNACSPDNETEFEDLLGKGFQTNTANSPKQAYFCITNVIVFAIGGNGQLMSEELGYPIADGNHNTKYFMLEMHYDNRYFIKDVPKNDQSGLRLFVTPTLRKFDGWTMLVGRDIHYIVVPPRQKAFQTSGHCSSKCLQEFLPKAGITVTSVFLHTHAVGKAVKLRQIRNGTELAPIYEDPYYDYNFQVFRKLKHPLKVLPGDHLITECVYDTSSRANSTWGGLSTSEEMCNVGLEYYPKTDLSFCISNPWIPDLGYFFGFNYTGRFIPFVEPADYRSLLNKLDFNKGNMKDVHAFMERGRFQNVCLKGNKNGSKDSNAWTYPEITTAYIKEPFQCN